MPNTRPAVAAKVYIAAPLRIGTEPGANVRATISAVELAIQRAPAPEPGATPSESDRLQFWTLLSEWANQNMTAIEGQLLTRTSGA